MQDNKEIYTPMEALLINATIRAEERAAALKTKKDINSFLALDLALLEAEAQVGLMDGLPVVEMEEDNNAN